MAQDAAGTRLDASRLRHLLGALVLLLIAGVVAMHALTPGHVGHGSAPPAAGPASATAVVHQHLTDVTHLAGAGLAALFGVIVGGITIVVMHWLVGPVIRLFRKDAAAQTGA